MHPQSIAIMTRFVDRYLKPLSEQPLRVYDVGSMDVDGGTYRKLFDRPAWNYIGLDRRSGKNVDIVLTHDHHWEIPDHTADVIISGQTLEHVRYFWLVVMEMTRILKPGGLMCLIAPSGGREHKHPIDCWRFFPDGMRALAEYCLLDVLECEIPKDANKKWQDCLLIAKKPMEA